MSKRSNGYSLIELLTVVAIIGVLAMVTMPAFAGMRRKAALRAASSELRAIFHLARSRAIAKNGNCGLKFLRLGGEWQYAIYDDGDGDGVRNEDIKIGVDRCIEPPRRALRDTSAVTIGLLPWTIIDPDGDKLAPTGSPVVMGKSGICSFSGLGGATPGTIYLTSGSELYAVRVYGTTAKIRTLRYDGAKKKWVER